MWFYSFTMLNLHCLHRPGDIHQCLCQSVGQEQTIVWKGNLYSIGFPNWHVSGSSFQEWVGLWTTYSVCHIWANKKKYWCLTCHFLSLFSGLHPWSKVAGQKEDLSQPGHQVFWEEQAMPIIMMGLLMILVNLTCFLLIKITFWCGSSLHIHTFANSRRQLLFHVDLPSLFTINFEEKNQFF